MVNGTVSQGTPEEPVSGGRGGEVDGGCCMPLRQPRGDAGSQLSF